MDCEYVSDGWQLDHWRISLENGIIQIMEADRGGYEVCVYGNGNMVCINADQNMFWVTVNQPYNALNFTLFEHVAEYVKRFTKVDIASIF